MKKLLTLFIIPFLSFGQCEDTNACNYGLVMYDNNEPIEYPNNDCEYLGDACLAPSPFYLNQAWVSPSDAGWYNDNLFAWDEKCNCTIYPGCQDENACNYDLYCEDNILWADDNNSSLDSYYSPECLLPGDNCLLSDFFGPADPFCNDELGTNWSVNNSMSQLYGVLNENCQCLCDENLLPFDYAYADPSGTFILVTINDCSQIGCSDPFACNYSPDAIIEIDCDYESCSCQDENACNYNSSANTNDVSNPCIFPFGCDTCSGEDDGTGSVVDNDADGDGVCDNDEIAGCQSNLACNYNSSATDSDGSCIFPIENCQVCSGETDGSGLVVNIDSDGDGVAECDEIVGCTDELADNYSAEATDEGDCIFLGCIDENALNYDSNANTDDGSCIAIVEGCTDGDVNTNGGVACNYDASANVDDDSCEYSTCSGCFIDSACNYDETVTIVNNDICEYPLDLYGFSYVDCDGNCINDTDGDGVCDEDEVSGCTDELACNYDSDPTTDTDNNQCTYAAEYYDCDENCINDADGDGVCDELEISGCTDNDPFTNSGVACNYDSSATEDDGLCEYLTCSGCFIETACNYDSAVTIVNNDVCIFAIENCQICSGESDGSGTIIDIDTDGDGVPECDEITGCTDESACNYDSNPTTDTDNSLCEYAEENFDCDGNCIVVVDCAGNCGGSEEIITYFIDSDGDGLGEDSSSTDLCSSLPQPDGFVIADLSNLDPCPLDEFNDSDGDGICDSDEILGCTDTAACNFDSEATDTNNSLCKYIDGICETCVDGNIIDNDIDNDGVCDSDEVEGCTDPSGCNYVGIDDITTDTNNDLCVYVDGICETCVDGQIVDNDLDNDGVCNDNEISGCTDVTACNYDSNPTTDTDNSQCTYAVEYYDCDGNCINDIDGDGVCNEFEISGCTDTSACNYDSVATDDDGSCTFIDGICETCENGVIVDNDADNDGVCDDDEILGCTDDIACNYNDLATDNNGTCTYIDGICESCENGFIVDNDSDDDGVCDDDEVVGCTDATACNYIGDEDVTTDSDNSLCTYPTQNYLDCSGNCLNDDDNDGVCNEEEVFGCTDTTADNFSDDATEDDGSCIFLGCIDNLACNFVDTANTDDGTCTYPAESYLDCDGNCINDLDGDSICDENEVFGCTDSAACNYVGDDDITTCLLYTSPSPRDQRGSGMAGCG